MARTPQRRSHASTRTPPRTARPARGRVASGVAPTAGAVTPDLARARRVVLDLLAIPGVSGREKAIANHIADRLRKAGCPADAIAFDGDHDFFESIRRQHEVRPVHCVLIDEAQFLGPRQVLQLTMVCDRLSIPVLCYGIRTDFQGEPFEGSKYLLAWADNIIEIKTICRSGKKATMNARLDQHGNRVTEGAQIDIGHHYEALSRKEFHLEQVSPVAKRKAP